MRLAASPSRIFHHDYENFVDFHNSAVCRSAAKIAGIAPFATVGCLICKIRRKKLRKSRKNLVKFRRVCYNKKWFTNRRCCFI